MILSSAIDSAREVRDPASAERRVGTALFLHRSLPGAAALSGRRFVDPVQIVTATRLDDVMPMLARVERLVGTGLTAAGYLAYEAGAAFERAAPPRDLADLPYLWFGLYEKSEYWERESASGEVSSPALTPGVDREDYRLAIERIHSLVGAGDTYQVNFTFPLNGNFTGSAEALLIAVAASQRDARHRCFLDIGSHQIVSVSPELFFRLDGDRIVTRPMKGTARRHPDPVEDLEMSDRLLRSPKERAENVMIVDLLRNDLGRIAQTGSVSVERLFDVERYQTLWTLTSTVSARTAATVPEIFRALFPSGSVTGAPKIRTMQIIDALEAEPRGVYCGAIGWWGPNRQAEFNVAIRTMVMNSEQGTATYRVGGGITWDSRPDSEYDECLLKAEVIRDSAPPFELLESLRLENGVYWLLDRHLERLKTSANYFGFPFDENAIRSGLDCAARRASNGPFKVRLRVSAVGLPKIDLHTLGPAARFRVGIARRAIRSQSPFVYNKTTHRAVYEAAAENAEGLDDVILYNERGELTESTRANLAVEIDGVLFTPPRAAGLLPGTFRQELLESGVLRERTLTLDDLRRSPLVRLINSVRGWIELDLVE